jgi:hypothetical protein
VCVCVCVMGEGGIYVRYVCVCVCSLCFANVFYLVLVCYFCGSLAHACVSCSTGRENPVGFDRVISILMDLPHVKHHYEPTQEGRLSCVCLK